MNGEVTILAKYLAEEVLTVYTSTFSGCPQNGEIVCEANKINLALSTPTIDPAILQQLADEGGVITLYDGNDAILGTLTINGYNGADLLYFNSEPTCSTITADACYFTFQLNTAGTVKQYLDLYPNEVISQNWEFTEISTFTARAPFSREFRVPLTEVNAEIFNAVQLSNYSGVDFYNKKLEATIFVDDVPVITGFIRLIRSIVQAGVRTDLELSFYGNTPSLFTFIGQKKLKDITDLVNISGAITPVEIITPPSNNITYSLIDRGTNNTLTYEQYTGFIAPAVTDYTPCLKWGYLLRQIIIDAGYELEATDLLTELDTIWMPWITQNPFAISQAVGGTHVYWVNTANMETYDAANTSVCMQFSNQYAPNWFNTSLDPLSYFTGVGWGDYPTGGFQRQNIEFNAWATFNYPYNTATTITISAIVTVGLTASGALTFPVATLNIPANSPGTYYIGGSVNFLLDSPFSNLISFKLTSSNGWGGTNQVYLYAGDPDYAFTGTGFSIGTRYPQRTNFWDFDAIGNAPDFTQAQFLQDVINMFNCAIVQDGLIDTKIKIVPMVNYLGSGLIDDWSDYLSYDKDIVIRSAAEYLKAKLTFTYSPGGDYYSKYFVDSAKRTYGNYEVIGYTPSPNDSPNQFANGSQEIKLNTQSTPCAIFPGTSIPVPRFIDAEGNYISPGVRALYLADTLYPPHSLPVRIMGHYNKTLPDATDKDLNWAPETPLHPITANPVYNLFNVYWRDYLNELYSPQARIMEAYFSLKLGDVLAFDFSNKYFINDSYWRVLKISDYKIGASELTKVVLIKILNADLSECELEIDRSLPDGSYTWTFQGEPAPGNLTCCNKIGGVWDALQVKCFGRPKSALVDSRPALVSPPNGQLPAKSVTVTEDYSGGLETTYQIAVGKNITDAGSDYSLLVGRDLETDITPDSTITGRNALVKNTGLHFGGGYRNGAGNPGTMQTGTIVLSNAHVYNFSGSGSTLVIGNDTLTHITLPTDTHWLVTLDIIATDINGFYLYSKSTTSFLNVGGGCGSTPVNVLISEDSLGGQLEIVPDIDTITTPGLFRIRAVVNTIGAYTYPTPAVTISCTLNYTQVR